LGEGKGKRERGGPRKGKCGEKKKSDKRKATKRTLREREGKGRFKGGEMSVPDSKIKSKSPGGGGAEKEWKSRMACQKKKRKPSLDYEKPRQIRKENQEKRKGLGGRSGMGGSRRGEETLRDKQKGSALRKKGRQPRGGTRGKNHLCHSHQAHEKKKRGMPLPAKRKKTARALKKVKPTAGEKKGHVSGVQEKKRKSQGKKTNEPLPGKRKSGTKKRHQASRGGSKRASRHCEGRRKIHIRQENNRKKEKKKRGPQQIDGGWYAQKPTNNKKGKRGGGAESKVIA